MKNKKELQPCPISAILELVGNKWKFFIIRDLLNGTKRFGELKKSCEITQKVLTSNLRELEEDGLLTRKVYAQVPPKVEYTLTDLGMTLQPVLENLYEWGTDYQTYMKLKK